jgi:hypothetical protein
MKYLALAGAISLAMFCSACTPEQRCKTYEYAHKKAIERAAGDAHKINVANIVYAPLKAGCAAQGVIIN